MTPPFLARRTLRPLLAAVLSASLLAACGGSTSQVDKFAPQRILAFGDELNVLTPDGHKYSVNALNADKTLNCELSPVWVQYLATTHYAKVFSQCVGNGTDIGAFQLAALNSRVDDLSTQVGGYISGSGFQATDLVTVLVGMHDVLDQYALYDGGNLPDLQAAVAIKGAELAGLVNTIAGTGARVLVSTVPDLGLTPYALQQKADVGDDRPAVLTALTDAFNKALRLNLINDGSKLGLLLADDLVRAAVRVPAAYGLTEVVSAACNTPLPNCTVDTVIDAAATKSSTFLWADSLHPGSVFHTQLGVQAVNRVNTLPF